MIKIVEELKSKMYIIVINWKWGKCALLYPYFAIFPSINIFIPVKSYLSLDFRSGNKNIRIGILVQHLGRSLLSSWHHSSIDRVYQIIRSQLDPLFFNTNKYFNNPHKIQWNPLVVLKHRQKSEITFCEWHIIQENIVDNINSCRKLVLHAKKRREISVLQVAISGERS